MTQDKILTLAIIYIYNTNIYIYPNRNPPTEAQTRGPDDGSSFLGSKSPKLRVWDCKMI